MKFVDQFRAAIADPHHRLACHGLWGPNHSARLARTMNPIVRSATCFVISDEVVEAACKLALDHPDVLAEMSRRARLPYEVCWFEWSNHAKMLACGTPPVENAPYQIGSLMRRVEDARFAMTLVSPTIEGARAVGLSCWTTVFSPDTDWGAHSGLPHTLLRNTCADPEMSLLRGSVPESVDEKGYDHLFMAPFIFGSAPWYKKEYHQAPLQWDAVRSLSRRTLVRFNEFEHDGIEKALDSNELVDYRSSLNKGEEKRRDPRHIAMRRDLGFSFQEEMGDLKLSIALISLISAGTKLIDIGEAEQKGATLSGGKIVRYMASRTVRLKLPIKYVMRSCRAIAHKIRKRRHEVMGHWCSSHKFGDPTCSHEYEDTSPRTKVCRFCQHKIWYKEEHLRGDASIGFVRHDYKVDARDRRGIQ